MDSAANLVKKTINMSTLVGGSLVTSGAIYFMYRIIKDKKATAPAIVATVITALVGIAATKYSWDRLNEVKETTVTTTTTKV
jgi:hypothetical protein